MFKKITLMLILALLVTTAGARDYSMTYHEIQVVDELGRPVTDITNLYIYGPGTTENSVIYMDRNRQKTIFIPMTEGSLNTTLVDGYCYWWGPDGYDFRMTNSEGVGPQGNVGHLPRTGSDGTIVFPSYLHAISTVQYDDDESITMGTEFDWVINGGFVADTLSFTPASDNASFIVGSDDINESASFYVYVSPTEGWFIDSSVASASWTGGALNCNVSSDHATNINTGTSTGAINIGSGTGTGAINIGNSAGGVISLDTNFNIVINADTTIAVSNDAGDQTYTLSDGSFTIEATENSPETFYVHVDGGATSSIFIYNETGTNAAEEGAVDAALQLKALIGGIGLYSGLDDVDAIRLEATGGGSSLITIANIQGTSASAEGQFDAAIQLYSKLGGIGLYSLLNDDDSIRIEANGGTDENITIYSNLGTGSDSITLLSDAGDIAITTTLGFVAISGIGNHAITATAVPDDGYGLNIGSTIAGATASQGSAAYFHTSLTGNTNDPTYNLGSWLDITAGTPTASVLAAIDCGIYESGANLSGVTHLIGLQVQMMLDDTNNASIVAMMRFNTDATASHNTPDYFFEAANPQSVAFVDNASYTVTDKIGAITIYIVGYGACYFYVYDHPGQ